MRGFRKSQPLPPPPPRTTPPHPLSFDSALESSLGIGWMDQQSQFQHQMPYPLGMLHPMQQSPEAQLRMQQAYEQHAMSMGQSLAHDRSFSPPHQRMMMPNVPMHQSVYGAQIRMPYHQPMPQHQKELYHNPPSPRHEEFLEYEKMMRMHEMQATQQMHQTYHQRHQQQHSRDQNHRASPAASSPRRQSPSPERRRNSSPQRKSHSRSPPRQRQPHRQTERLSRSPSRARQTSPQRSRAREATPRRSPSPHRRSPSRQDSRGRVASPDRRRHEPEMENSAVERRVVSPQRDSPPRRGCRERQETTNESSYSSSNEKDVFQGWNTTRRPRDTRPLTYLLADESRQEPGDSSWADDCKPDERSPPPTRISTPIEKVALSSPKDTSLTYRGVPTEDASSRRWMIPWRSESPKRRCESPARRRESPVRRCESPNRNTESSMRLLRVTPEENKSKEITPKTVVVTKPSTKQEESARRWFRRNDSPTRRQAAEGTTQEQPGKRVSTLPAVRIRPASPPEARPEQSKSPVRTVRHVKREDFADKPALTTECPVKQNVKKIAAKASPAAISKPDVPRERGPILIETEEDKKLRLQKEHKLQKERELQNERKQQQEQKQPRRKQQQTDDEEEYSGDDSETAVTELNLNISSFVDGCMGIIADIKRSYRDFQNQRQQEKEKQQQEYRETDSLGVPVSTIEVGEHATQASGLTTAIPWSCHHHSWKFEDLFDQNVCRSSMRESASMTTEGSYSLVVTDNGITSPPAVARKTVQWSPSTKTFASGSTSCPSMLPPSDDNVQEDQAANPSQHIQTKQDGEASLSTPEEGLKTTKESEIFYPPSMLSKGSVSTTTASSSTLKSSKMP